MRKQSRVLKELKRCIEENINHPLDENYTNIKDINIGDVFVCTEMDEDGGYNCYFRIVELGDDNELFLLPSDDNGNLLDDLSEIDSDDFTSLNAYVKSNELFELVKEWTLMPVK